MNNIIHIEFYTDLGTNARNEMRFRMEMCEWKRKWNEAVEANDYETMELLDSSFDLVGLP